MDTAIFEAKCLGRETGLRWQACHLWMKTKGFRDVGDIIRAYARFGREAGYEAIIGEIEDLVLTLPMDKLRTCPPPARPLR